MLKVILAVVGLLAQILTFIFAKRKRLKPAGDILPEESPTAKAVEAAEVKAEEKFGPRPVRRDRRRVREGVPREVVSSSPKS